MKIKDYYSVLNVDKNAAPDAIKKSFRELAKKYHPDAHPGDKAAEERFKEISEAYDILSDKEKRAKYDSLMDAQARGYDFSNFGAGGQTYKGDFDFSAIFNDLFGGRQGGGGFSYQNSGGFSDIFDMFGQTQGSRPGRRQRANVKRDGRDIQATVSIDLAQAVLGSKITLRAPDGEMVRLKIPPGTQGGTKFRIEGKGEPPAAAGGKRGNLLILVNVKIPAEESGKTRELFEKYAREKGMKTEE